MKEIYKFGVFFVIDTTTIPDSGEVGLGGERKDCEFGIESTVIKIESFNEEEEEEESDRKEKYGVTVLRFYNIWGRCLKE